MSALLELFSLPKISGAELEIEVRIGSFGNKFQSGVPSDEFFALMSVLKCTQYEYSLVSFFGDIRRIDYAGSYSDLLENKFSNTIFQNKKKGAHVDIPELGMRVASAYEYPANKVSGTPDLTRQRVRCERQLFDGRVKVHMTQIYERTAMANWCEVEVEFNMDKPENHFTDTASVTKFLRMLYLVVHNTLQFNNDLNVVESFNREMLYNTIDLSGEAPAEKHIPVSSEVHFNFNKPIDLSFDRYIGMIKSNNYTASLKADGVHGFLLLNESGCHIITGRTMVNTLTRKIGSKETLILEGEMVTVDEEKTPISYFIAFDILKYNGEFTTGLPYLGRLAALRSVCKKLQNKELPIAMKKVYTEHITLSLTELFSPTKKAETYYELAPIWCIKRYTVQKPLKTPFYETDGLVFTSKSPYVNPHSLNASKRTVSVYKWKPVNRLTIDFQVARGQGGDLVLLVKANNELIVFNCTSGKRNFDERPMTARVSPKHHNKVAIGQVAEFIYAGNGYFDFVRTRSDKKFPNNVNVARDVWDVIHNHVSEKMLVGDDMTLLRKHHNQVKLNHIKTFVSRDDVVLDIGGGRGGDLDKYIEAEARTVVFVEPNADNLAVLYDRLKDLKRRYKNETVFKNTRFYALKAFGQETDKIRSYLTSLGIEKVDVVAMFFSLTFFYGKESDLAELSNTVRACARPDSLLIGTVMDGSETSKFIDSGLNYDYFQVKKVGAGWTPKVLIRLPKDTIVGDQEENLVYINHFEKKLHTRMNYKQFTNWEELSESQRSVNALYYTFAGRVCHKRLEPDETKNLSGSIFRVGTDGSITAALMTAVSSTYRTGDHSAFLKQLYYDFSVHFRDVLGSPEQIEKMIQCGPDRTQIPLLSQTYSVNIIILNCVGQIESVNGESEDWTLVHPVSVVFFKCGKRYEVLMRRLNVPCEATDTYLTSDRYVFPSHDFRINQLLNKKRL